MLISRFLIEPVVFPVQRPQACLILLEQAYHPLRQLIGDLLNGELIRGVIDFALY